MSVTNKSGMAPLFSILRKRMPTWTVPALIVLCIYMAWPMAWPVSNSFCVKKMRFLSDDEFIQIALQRQTYKGVSMVNDLEPISSFHERNPDCCSVDRRARDAGLLDLYYVEVRLFYEVVPRVNEHIGTYYESYQRMSACGQAIESYGMGTDKR